MNDDQAIRNIDSKKSSLWVDESSCLLFVFIDFIVFTLITEGGRYFPLVTPFASNFESI